MKHLVEHPRVTREYETIFILRPDLLEEDRTKVIERVQGTIEKLGGAILKTEDWGKRKLAYNIKKNSHGIYFYYQYLGFNDLVTELERNFRILEPVLKYLTIKLDEVDREARIAEAAQQVEEDKTPIIDRHREPILLNEDDDDDDDID
ncbi:MAG: 30S ribosomal protein S6 [Deltaproteobacteria bacterium CG2_30_63_29]|nr:MAG: 30S ribosomal protein S6 [Deltaproteobacteria bacterium CG2_30_63_29]PJB37089.1 MAG: 30S ribosomal protein S6 [Deltaproteobacteria bacterium CG_4_9_14_3_um_filter_63_12]